MSAVICEEVGAVRDGSGKESTVLGAIGKWNVRVVEAEFAVKEREGGDGERQMLVHSWCMSGSPWG
jgi:hypothetical protein